MKMRLLSEEVGGITGEHELLRFRKGRATATVAPYTLSFRIEKGHLYVSRKSRRGSSESGHWRFTTISIVPDSRRVRSRLGYGETRVQASAGRPSAPRGPRATSGRRAPYRRASLERS